MSVVLVIIISMLLRARVRRKLETDDIVAHDSLELVVICLCVCVWSDCLGDVPPSVTISSVKVTITFPCLIQCQFVNMCLRAEREMH